MSDYIQTFDTGAINSKDLFYVKAIKNVNFTKVIS